jgi:hypothetical protein
MGWLEQFAEERKLYRLLLLIGGVVAVLKGLRLPYLWSATQAQIDYRYGFLRRGLFGEACRQLHIPIFRYGVFSILSFLLLGCFLLLLARSVINSSLDQRSMGAFSALIAGSCCISLLVNVVGYYDIVMAVLVLLTLSIANPRSQLIFAIFTGVIGVLVHELYAIAFLPVSLVGVICWASERAGGNRISRWIAFACAAVLPWVVVLTIAHRPEMTDEHLHMLQAAIRARVNFVPDDGMLNVLKATTRDNVRFMLGPMMSAGAWWVEEFLGIIAFVPTAIFFLMIAFRLSAGRPRVVRWWLILSTFAPLALNITAYDRYRWLAMVTLNGFFCSIAMSSAAQIKVPEAESISKVSFGVGWRHAAVLLLLLNLCTDVGFFRGHARNFPFREYWTGYRAEKQAGRPFLEWSDVTLKP